MVGPVCCLDHSHCFQTSLLFHSQVQGENSPRASEASFQEDSKASEEEAIFQEDFLFTLPFKKTPTCSFFVFSRGFQLSNSLLASHFSHIWPRCTLALPDILESYGEGKTNKKNHTWTWFNHLKFKNCFHKPISRFILIF